MKTRILEIGQVKIDKELYPRIFVDFTTVARYLNAMRSGENFPPIRVAELDGQYLLVDGAHRLNAHKAMKETHVQVEVLTGLDRKQIYLEAIKANVSHGRPLSTQEVTKICITLKNWEMSEQQIQSIVRIPADHLGDFVAKRMTRITETQEEIALKKPLQGLSIADLPTMPNQTGVGGRSQVSLLEAVISILKNGWIDLKSELITERLRTVHRLIGELNIPEKVRKQRVSKGTKTEKKVSNGKRGRPKKETSETEQRETIAELPSPNAFQEVSDFGRPIVRAR